MLSIALLALPVLQVAQLPAPAWVQSGTPGAYTSTATGSAMDVVGAVLTLHSTTATSAAIGTIRWTMPADTFRARRLRLSADIDARDVPGGAAPWIRVDGATGPLLLENASDRAIRGTNAGHIESTIYVPETATTIVFGLMIIGTGDATARGLRIEVLATGDANAPIALPAKLMLDSAYALVRQNSLWRDTVTWSSVGPAFRAIAAGSTSTAETYPAIRYLLGRLGDHHSFLMPPMAAQSFSGGARGAGSSTNPPALVRLQEAGIGYVSVPAFAGGQRQAMTAFAKSMQDELNTVVPQASCRWIVDLRENSGGNMWPMLGGLRPFLGEGGLGAFVTAAGSGPQWRAGDVVDVKPGGVLMSLDSAYVAVLTGPRTASSGEAVAIALRGRPHTRSFGLPTAGLSTANQMFALPDSSMILLTVSVDADRTGKRYGEKIEPDELVPANPPGVGADSQLVRAIAWLRSQSTCGR